MSRFERTILTLLLSALFASTAMPIDARAADSGQATALAKKILDSKRPDADRKQLVVDHPKLSLNLLKAMVADMPADDSKEEYRRIPWIWRVTWMAGKRNDLHEMKPIVEFCLPQPNEPLSDWKAVVLGGGIINGIGLSGGWADEQIEKMIADDPGLRSRWDRLLVQAAEMADNEKVFKGTRYDALRIIGMDRWDRRGGQLTRYLSKETDDELQQGAIGGLGDMRDPHVASAILSGFGHYNKENREFALKALLREPGRTMVLLDAIEAGTVKPADLGPKWSAKLTQNSDGKIASRAKKLLPAAP